MALVNRGFRKPMSSAARRRLLVERPKEKCAYCGSTERLEWDHINPWANGGGDDPENIQVLCRRCNLRKGEIVGYDMLLRFGPDWFTESEEYQHFLYLLAHD